MADNGYMNFFTVDECGLYRTGKSESNGCELEETFDLISQWKKDRPLSATIPWDSEEKDNRPKCYCKDIFKNEKTGDFFLVLWKSDSTSKGTLYGVGEDDKEGEATVVEYTNNHKGKKVIWGRPMYYWVMPSLRTIVSIKFDHSVCDADLLRDYVIGCITNRVKHEKRTKKRTDKGYVRLAYEDQSGTNYSFRFNISLKSIKTASIAFAELAKKITHIIKRETIEVHVQDEKAQWVKRLGQVPFASARPNTQKRKIEVKAEARPTVSEIKQIVEKHSKENRKKSKWDNVGFATENGVKWVDEYRLTDKITMPDTKNSIHSAQSLSLQISSQRSLFVSKIPVSDSISEQTKNEAKA